MEYAVISDETKPYFLGRYSNIRLVNKAIGSTSGNTKWLVYKLVKEDEKLSNATTH